MKTYITRYGKFITEGRYMGRLMVSEDKSRAQSIIGFKSLCRSAIAGGA